jgi:hypothetical protein
VAAFDEVSFVLSPMWCECTATCIMTMHAPLH